jgi:ATP phosphoribosyltransferase
MPPATMKSPTLDRDVHTLTVALVKDRLLSRAERAREGLEALVKSDAWGTTHGRGLEVLPALCKIRDAQRLITQGLFDCGIVSEDWLLEERDHVQVVELADLRWYQIVIAPIVEIGFMGDSLEEFVRAHDRPSILVVTPYGRLVREIVRPYRARTKVLRVYGTTEVLVPRFADMAIDCVETGATVRRLGLRALAPVSRCSVKFVANEAALRDGRKRPAIEMVAELFQGMTC